VKGTKKFRTLRDAPRLIPPVSFAQKDRTRLSPLSGNYRGPRGKTRKDGIAQRTAMRRLLAKKLALIPPDMLDQSLPSYKNYQEVVTGITSDLGGKGRLSSIETVLVNAFAISTVRLADLTARQLLGDQTRLQDEGFARTITALVRLSEKLGITRRTKELPTLASYLGSKSNGSDTIDGEVIDNE
jgi:hypothetical protein